MKFSACWIVKNEAENIKKSIMSVKACCDEMIVVDTGSNDDTVKIAKECGARVEHFKWISDFSAAKNYALSLAKGDYVIFLDGDEYFDPPLTKKSGREFYKTFKESRADTLRIPRYEMEKEDGSIKGIQAFDRILRRKTVHFENKVHEIPRRAGGKAVRFGLMGGYRLIHTGYSKDIVADKSRRNITILASERKKLTDPVELFMNTSYLMREYMATEEYDKARECCHYLLDNYEVQKDVCNRYHRGYMQRFYQAIAIVEMFPEEFEREELYQKLFGGIKENYPETRDAAIAELHYQVRFHYREDRFLRELAKVEPKLEKLPFSEIIDCRQAESIIFERAAEAAHMRGDGESAVRWAQHAMMHSQTMDPRPLQILFYHLRGNPPELFAEFICELVDMENTDISKIVMWMLHADEYRGVYDILLKKGFPAAEEDFINMDIDGIVGAKWCDRTDVFLAKAKLFNARMKYADIAHDPEADDAALRNLQCAQYLAHARIMLGEYSEAYDVLQPYLEAGSPDYNLLRLLLVIAENAEGRLAENAKIRYEDGVAILDENLGLSDVINTEPTNGTNAQKRE